MLFLQNLSSSKKHHQFSIFQAKSLLVIVIRVSKTRAKVFASMTIERARKLLGSKYKHLSDIAIKKKISGLEILAESLVDVVLMNIDTISDNNEKSNSISPGFIGKTSIRG